MLLIILHSVYAHVPFVIGLCRACAFTVGLGRRDEEPHDLGLRHGSEAIDGAVFVLWLLPVEGFGYRRDSGIDEVDEARGRVVQGG